VLFGAVMQLRAARQARSTQHGPKLELLGQTSVQHLDQGCAPINTRSLYKIEHSKLILSVSRPSAEAAGARKPLKKIFCLASTQPCARTTKSKRLWPLSHRERLILKRSMSQLKTVPHLFVFGDHLQDSPSWQNFIKASQRYHAALIGAGVKSDWIDLPILGIKGNSHMMMMDRNSDQIAELVAKWLEQSRAD
jgi:pimeloyl-ACP methyl ester carboxylesterase